MATSKIYNPTKNVYVPGEAVYYTTINCSGIIVNSGNEGSSNSILYFTVPLPKGLHSAINTATLETLTGTLSGINGIIGGMQGVNLLTSANVTVTVEDINSYGGAVIIKCQFNSHLSAPNGHTPATYYGNVKIRFSVS